MRTIDWLGLFVITAQWAVGAALVVSVVLAVQSYLERRKSLLAMRMARISPEELYRQIAAGEEPLIVDLRHPLDFLAAPRTLPRALRMTPAQVGARWKELAGDREIVVYCTCPNEETAVKVARQLRDLGVERVHPLAGGPGRVGAAGFSDGGTLWRKWRAAGDDPGKLRVGGPFGAGWDAAERHEVCRGWHGWVWMRRPASTPTRWQVENER